MIPLPLPRTSFSRCASAALVLAALSSGTTVGAQELLQALRASALQDPEPVVREGTQPSPSGWYQRLVEVSFNDSMFEVGYRQTTQHARDYYHINAIANDEDAYVVSGRLVRQGQLEGRPLRLGVGIGAYGAFFDETDETVYAISLIGVAEYDLETAYPTTISADLAYAPSVSTFDDGEDLLEFKLRATMDISRVAAGFVGFRLLESDTDTADVEIDRGFHVGIRLAL